MSHQTGIKANEELKRYFAKCKDGRIRVCKIAIEEEQLVLKQHENVHHDWEKDFKHVAPLVEENQPCYILYRLDEKNSNKQHGWLLISWVPDTAPIRQKMLYASTKATLKQEFGTAQIKDELHATIESEVTLDGYKRHKSTEATPPPLSLQEEQLNEIKKTEVNTEINVDTKQSLGSLAFPLTKDAKDAIKDMTLRKYNYLQLFIDMSQETIHLAISDNISLDQLPSKVPENNARYHLYKFSHSHEGDFTESIVFIYSMPGYNCSIKERMLYSSCKNYLTDLLPNLGVEVAKKLEIDSGSELTEQYLYEEIHPTYSLHRPKFAKPKGPPGRGPKRMTKPQNNADE